jgi:hypothetical protein
MHALHLSERSGSPLQKVILSELTVTFGEGNMLHKNESLPRLNCSALRDSENGSISDGMSPRYRAFNHVCQSLGLAGDRLVPVFTAYFDESGTHGGSPAVVVGGYIGVVKKWKEFGEVWDAQIIKREGISVLHRTDLENFEGEFAGWRRDRQIKVIRRAHKIIKKYTQIGAGISQAVVPADFENVIPDAVKRAYGGPYGWAAFQCMIHISKWADDRGYREPIHWVFEAGARGRHQVDRMFSLFAHPPVGVRPSLLLQQKFRLAGWTFSPKECVCQLQAADFYSYESYKEIDNSDFAAGVRKRNVRKSALDLFRDKQDHRFYSDKHHLKLWVDAAPEIIKTFEERERMLRAAGREDLI